MRAEPLGSLLVSRGHITEEQLELALTEQKATGRPLGEIVVARGFAAAPTVAQALATQHGGLLKTEYGFATGWGGQENSQARVPSPEPPRNDEVDQLRASLEEHRNALDAWKQSHAELEERLAQAQQVAPPVDGSGLAQLEAERETLQAELAARDSAVAELEERLAEAQKPAPPVDDPRLTRLAAERDSLQAELAARDRSIEQLQSSRAKVEAGRAELEQALANEVDRGDALRAEVAATGASESVRAELEERLAVLQGEAEERLKAAAAEFDLARDGLDQQLAAARERAASLEAELARRDADSAELEIEPEGRWDSAESHLVFFQGADGYELVERSGPPPSEGSSVGAQIVARISRAPIPGSALPCAYLIA
jgi:chromosome segregation ATPase